MWLKKYDQNKTKQELGEINEKKAWDEKRADGGKNATETRGEWM